MKKLDQIRLLLFVWILSFSIAKAEALQIKIGATLPLTGRLAIAGEDTRRGIELAVAEFSSPNVSLKVVFDDNQHNPKMALSSARKLLEIDKVDVLISMWDVADVVAPLAEQKKIPHLAIRWNPHITEKYKYTFTVESTYRSYVESLLALLNRLSVHSVGILTEDSQGWNLSADYMKEKGAGAGVSVVADERYLPTDSDYRAVVLRVLQKAPDMLVLLSNPPNTQMLIKQIRELAPKQRFTGYFEIIEPSIVEGIPFVAQFEVTDWFSDRFKKQVGETPKSRAAQAYDIVHLLAVAGESGQMPTPDSLVAAAKSKAFAAGAVGPLVTKSPRVIESQCVWKVARNNSFEIYSDAKEKH